MTNHDMVDEDRPMPPCAGERRRYAGTQPFSPHQAKRQHEFINAMAMVTVRMRGSNNMPKRPRSAGAADFHKTGSSTLRRIHSVKSAGSTPTKKTPRQPQSGITIMLTSAARP